MLTVKKLDCPFQLVLGCQTHLALVSGPGLIHGLEEWHEVSSWATLGLWAPFPAKFWIQPCAPALAGSGLEPHAALAPANPGWTQHAVWVPDWLD